MNVEAHRNNKRTWDNLQFDDPDGEGYIALRRTSGQVLTPLAMSADRGTIAFAVPEGGLAQGEVLLAHLGGPAGAVAPRLALLNKFFTLFPARADAPVVSPNYTEEVMGNIIGVCLIHVVGNEATRLRVYAPSQALPGGRVTLLIRPEDTYGNVACDLPGRLVAHIDGQEVAAQRRPVEGFNCCRLGLTLTAPGIYRVEIEDIDRGLRAVSNPILCTDQPPQQRLLWGYLHGHTELSDGSGSVDHYYRHMRDACELDFGAVSDHDHLWETPDWMWNIPQEAAVRYNEPGRFTVFLGYEWAKWRRNGDGDRNVYYLHDYRPLYRSDDGHYPTPPDLFRALAQEDAIVIPHHTASIGNHCDWKDHDTVKERLVEIYSMWGNAERGGNQGNPFPSKRIRGSSSGEVPAGFVQRALEMGWRVGFTGGGDDHLGHAGAEILAHGGGDQYKAGLMAVWATENTREAIWEALWQRRCYATTGPRIVVDFRLNGWAMGSELRLAEHPELEAMRYCRATVHGTAPIKTVEIVRNNQDVHTWHGNGPDATVEWEDQETLADINLPPTQYAAEPFTFYYVRVTQEDGEMAWASPVWIIARP